MSGLSKKLVNLIHPCALVVSLFVLVISGLAVRADSGDQTVSTASSAKTTVPVVLPPDTRVAVLTPGTGERTRIPFAQVKPGSEFIHNGHLHRMNDLGKATILPEIDERKLADADRPYDQANSRTPHADDVVQVLSSIAGFAGHAVLRTVEPGTTICFQGKTYELKEDRKLWYAGIAAQIAGLVGEERRAVFATLMDIDGGTTPSGPLSTKWGATFRNIERRLPTGVTYREYRVEPSPDTMGAGTRRIVVGSDGAVYYTRDHYASFVRLR